MSFRCFRPWLLLTSLFFILFTAAAAFALFCPRCGKENAPAVRFCSYCGLPVQEVFNYVKFLENKERQISQLVGGAPNLVPGQAGQAGQAEKQSPQPVSNEVAQTQSQAARVPAQRGPVKGVVHTSRPATASSDGGYEPVRENAPSGANPYGQAAPAAQPRSSTVQPDSGQQVSDLFGARFESMDSPESASGSGTGQAAPSAAGAGLAGEKSGEGTIVILLTYKKKDANDTFNRKGKVYINSAFVGDIETAAADEEKKDYGFNSKLFGKLASYSDEIHFKFERSDIPEGVYQVKVVMEQKGFLRNVSRYKVFDNVEIKTGEATRLMYQWNSRTPFGN